MAFNINEFRANLPGGGARPNLFEVNIPVPAALGGFQNEARKIKFQCKTASIPAGTIEPVELSYFGRLVKFAGGKTFEDWETTVINDEDFAVRRFIEAWQEKIIGNATNRSTAASPQDYAVDANVIQFGKNGNPIRQYAMMGAWPSVVAAIELDWGTAEPEEFAITWTFDWWESVEIDEPTFTFDASINIPDFGSIGIGVSA